MRIGVNKIECTYLIVWLICCTKGIGDLSVAINQFAKLGKMAGRKCKKFPGAWWFVYSRGVGLGSGEEYFSVVIN